MYRNTTILFTRPHPARHLIAVREDWFVEYIENDFGIIKECYLEEVVNNWKELNMLGKS